MTRYELIRPTDDVTITVEPRPIDPRWGGSVGHAQLRMETDDLDSDRDEHQYAYVNFSRREHMRELIEALTAACDISFPVNTAEENDGEVQRRLGFVADMERARNEDLARHREAVATLTQRDEKMAEHLKQVRSAADRLYVATLHTIHDTADGTVRSYLSAEVLAYDYAVRDLTSVTLEPAEATR